ncbi:MAG TPA: hypothetical protein VN871_15290, partial [Mycobacterium sp.]|nr:hypothetical protein [Mycobacterium sp.]
MTTVVVDAARTNSSEHEPGPAANLGWPYPKASAEPAIKPSRLPSGKKHVQTDRPVLDYMSQFWYSRRQQEWIACSNYQKGCRLWICKTR